jgi:hypothetical protein
MEHYAAIKIKFDIEFETNEGAKDGATRESTSGACTAHAPTGNQTFSTRESCPTKDFCDAFGGIFLRCSTIDSGFVVGGVNLGSKTLEYGDGALQVETTPIFTSNIHCA